MLFIVLGNRTQLQMVVNWWRVSISLPQVELPCLVVPSDIRGPSQSRCFDFIYGFETVGVTMTFFIVILIVFHVNTSHLRFTGFQTILKEWDVVLLVMLLKVHVVIGIEYTSTFFNQMLEKTKSDASRLGVLATNHNWKRFFGEQSLIPRAYTFGWIWIWFSLVLLDLDAKTGSCSRQNI